MIREENRYTNGDAADIILDEGLGYAVQYYCSGHDFQDPTTRRLWEDADKALNLLVNHIRKETGRDL